MSLPEVCHQLGTCSRRRRQSRDAAKDDRVLYSLPLQCTGIGGQPVTAAGRCRRGFSSYCKDRVSAVRRGVTFWWLSNYRINWVYIYVPIVVGLIVAISWRGIFFLPREPPERVDGRQIKRMDSSCAKRRTTNPGTVRSLERHG